MAPIYGHTKSIKNILKNWKKYLNVSKNTKTRNVLQQDLYRQISVTSTNLIKVALKTTKYYYLDRPLY